MSSRQRAHKPPIVFLQLPVGREKTSGKDLEIASDNVTWDELVATFTKVTGKKAVHKRLTIDEFFDLFINVDLEAATHHVGLSNV